MEKKSLTFKKSDMLGGTVRPVCAKCHGENISPELLTSICHCDDCGHVGDPKFAGESLNAKYGSEVKEPCNVRQI